MTKKLTSAQRLYEDLRDQIANRQLLPGMVLPSENELCERYAISRPTVRRVQEKLCLQNMIEKRPGIGTFVKVFDRAGVSAMVDDFRLGLDFMDQSEYYYGQIIQGITRSKAGRNCMFSFFQPEQLRQGLLPANVHAMLLLKIDEDDTSALKQIALCGKPALVVNRMLSNPNIAYIAVDHRREAEVAVEHLLRLGHREIAIVGSSALPGHTAHFLRTKGWEDAFRKAGLGPPEHLQLDADELIPPSKAIEQFIREKSFTAVFFTNLAMMRSFSPEFSRCRGKRIDTLELMCFDDLDGVNDLDNLNCSFVRMPLAKIGEMAVEYLRKKKVDPQHPVLRKLLPCSMVIRHKLD